MFHGSMVALVTPMAASGQVDYTALERLIEFHIDNGTAALVIAGTTGEAASLSLGEKRELFQKSIDIVAQRVPVIVGSATCGTASTIELTELAMEVGASGALIMTPAYVKPTQEGLIAHYKAVASRVALPIILYNVPGRTAVDMLPESVAALKEVPNIVGIKEATGDLSRAQRILELCGDAIDVYSGDDASSCELMLSGAKGTISVTANVAPKLMSLMATAAISGDRELAESHDKPLQNLHQALFLESNPIPVKWALHEMGFIQPGLRLPLTELSKQHHDKLKLALSVIQ